MGGAATAGTAANSKAAVSPVFLIHDPSRVLIYGYTPSPQRGEQVPILCVQEREIESLGFPPPSIGQVHNQISDPVPTLNPGRQAVAPLQHRKSTRLNSRH